MLGISLLWKSPSQRINIDVDLTVTLLNRESFTENQHFQIPNANFYMSHGESNSSEYSTVNGNRSFISIADLLSHRPRFVDINGEFQIEIRLSNIRTSFENEFTIQSKLLSSGGSFDYEAMEVRSETFGYGGFAWEVVVSPQPQLLTNPWAVNTSTPKSTNRIGLQQFAQGSVDKNLELDNLGFHVTLMRKAVKSVNRRKSTKNKNENNNNNNMTSNNKQHETNNDNGIDIGSSHRSDELLSRLTYKVLVTSSVS